MHPCQGTPQLQDPKSVSEDEYAARTSVDNIVKFMDERNEYIQTYCALSRVRKYVPSS